MASMAKLQLQSSSAFGSQYDVFLSFRGVDTRKNFTDHLYEAFVHSGFRVFRDDDEIKRGEAIKLELERGIEKSLVYVIVFSKAYASSKWCLEELVMILQYRRNSSGNTHMVLPIFYDVGVEQLKIWSQSNFEEALKGAKNFDDQRLNLWREALREASKLAGLVLQNEADGHEAKFIKKIVQVVGNKLSRRLLRVPDHIYGIHSTLEEIDSLLQDKSRSVGVIMICGMGGIGKTTLAHFVCNLRYRMFDGHTILSNIQDCAKEPRDLVKLQKQLLSNITGRKDSISCLEEGIVKIQDAMCSKRVLLVLDDVNDKKHLSATLGSITDLTSKGSKIIITTRNHDLLRTESSDNYHKVKVPLLGWTDALELFSWYAFGKNHPIEDYLELSKEVVYCSGCLPLALKVLGSLLFGRPVEFWNNMVQKLKKVPNPEILGKLRISFECLEDKDDKELFLDIACFFVGRHKDFVTRILDGCGFYTKIGIQNLIDLSLLTVDNHNHINMHHLLRDMGRRIVCEESHKEPCNRSRLWDHKDSFDVLTEKKGTKAIEGIILDMHMLGDNYSTLTGFSIVKNKRKRSCHDFLDGLSTENCAKRLRIGFLDSIYRSLRHSREVYLETDAFIEITNLRLLQLNNVKISGKFEGFPKRLRWLCWVAFPLHSLPDDLPVRELIVLEMQHSCLKQLWRGNKIASKLEVLDLSYSQGLKKTSDLSRLINLETLILKGCSNLIEVHESIGKLERLASINLKNCTSLKKLPKEIGMLNNLEELIMSGCSSLTEWPNEIKQMKALKVLLVDGVATNNETLKSWHSSIKSWVLSRRGYTNNREILSISFPSTLVRLSLKRCNLSDDAFSSIDFSNLSQLRILNLSRNMITCLPEGIRNCNRLNALYLKQCPKLKSIVGIKNIGLQNAGNSFRYSLECKDCPNLAEIESCFKLEPINNNDIELLGKWGFFNLESMANIHIRYHDLRTILRTWRYTSERLIQVDVSPGRITKELPLQRLYNFNGVYSYFLPGVEIPSCFMSTKSSSSSISTKEESETSTSELHGGFQRRRPLQLSLVVDKRGDCVKRLPGLITCVVYRISVTECRESLVCDIENKTKDMRWRYRPKFLGLSRNSEEDMLWISHWNFGDNNDHLLDDGDVIEVSVHRCEAHLKELAVAPNLFESTSTTQTPTDSFLYETAVPVGFNAFRKFDCIDFRGHI